MFTWLFRGAALAILGAILTGTIIGDYPIEEIWVIAAPITMWLIAWFFEKTFGTSYPKFLDAQEKRILAGIGCFIFGVLFVF